MAAWTASTVKSILPEFAAVLDATIDLYIAMAARQINDVEFGDRAVDAGVFLTGHLMFVTGVLGASSGAVGPLTGVTVGQIAVTYGQVKNAMHADSLASNRYGQEYDRLC